MAGEVIMTYGDYRFDPVPLMDVTKEFSRGANKEVTGVTYRATLTGSVVAGRGINSDETGTNGIIQIDRLQDALMEGISSAMQPDVGADDCEDGEEQITGRANFRVTCNGEQIWDASGVRFNSINFASGPWVDKSDYTIELEWDGSGVSGQNLSDFQESWSMSPAENTNYYEFDLGAPTGVGQMSYLEKHVPTWNVSHSVSAVGKADVDSQGCVKKGAADIAAEEVYTYLGLDQNVVKGMCVFCFKEGVHAWNHSRSIERDEVAGSYAVTETWLVRPSGINSSTENNPWQDTYTVDIAKGTQAAITTATIRGTIQGFEEVEYCSGTDPCVDGMYAVASSKYENAKRGFDATQERIVDSPSQPFQENLIFRRMNYFASGEAYRPMNLNHTDHSITHDPANGAINYSFTFNDKPKLCGVETIYENYSISDTNQADRIAEIGVIGRVAGPILQSLGTSTVRRRSINIEMVVAPNLTPYASPTLVQSAIEGCGSGCDALGAAPSLAAEAIVSSFDPAGCTKTGIADPTTYISFKTADSESWEPLTGKYSRRVDFTFTECPSGAGYTGV